MSDRKLAKEIAETVLAAIGNVPGVNKVWLVNVIESKLPSSPERCGRLWGVLVYVG